MPPTTVPPFYGDEGGILDPPGAPKSVQVSHGAIQCETERPAYFVVSWEPAGDGVHVETYTVSCVPTSGIPVEVSELPNNVYSVEVGPLDANKMYTCAVTAVNAAGQSNLLADPITAM